MNRNEDFTEVYKKYIGFSLGLAYKIVKDRDMAEDVVQDAFCKLYRLGDRLDLSDEQKVKALVAIATANRAKDYLKKSYNRLELDTDEIFGEKAGEVGPNLEDDILAMETNKYKKMVLMRFREHNPESYDILMKVKYLNIPAKDVAEEYGYSRNSINNRILRAREWLNKELEKLEE